MHLQVSHVPRRLQSSHMKSIPKGLDRGETTMFCMMATKSMGFHSGSGGLISLMPFQPRLTIICLFSSSSSAVTVTPSMSLIFILFYFLFFCFPFYRKDLFFRWLSNSLQLFCSRRDFEFSDSWGRVGVTRALFTRSDAVFATEIHSFQNSVFFFFILSIADFTGG